MKNDSKHCTTHLEEHTPVCDFVWNLVRVVWRLKITPTKNMEDILQSSHFRRVSNFDGGNACYYIRSKYAQQ